MPMPSVEPIPWPSRELRFDVPDDAHEASYFAASARMESFSATFMAVPNRSYTTYRTYGDADLFAQEKAHLAAVDHGALFSQEIGAEIPVDGRLAFFLQGGVVRGNIRDRDHGGTDAQGAKPKVFNDPDVDPAPAAAP